MKKRKKLTLIGARNVYPKYFILYNTACFWNLKLPVLVIHCMYSMLLKIDEAGWAAKNVFLHSTEQKGLA